MMAALSASRSHPSRRGPSVTLKCGQRTNDITLHVAVYLVLLLFLPMRAYSQRTDIQSWTQLLVTAPLDSEQRWFTSIDIQPRLGNNASELERLFIRPSVGYNISPRVATILGYAWTPAYVNTLYEEDFRDEHRTWQAVSFRHIHWGLNWQHRLQQEQRFIQDTSSTSHRSLYLLRGSYALPDFPYWGITGFGQVFVNANSVELGPRAGFDRTRLFLGPFFISGAVRYEFGYLGEYAPRFGDDSRVIHALMVSAQLSL